MFVISERLKKIVENLPEVPGSYQYFDKEGNYLYIGKAKRLKTRVKSYFLNFAKLDPKIQIMIEQIHNIEFITVDSEVEALILETNLIKKYHPKYNKLMKDDKNFCWIKISSYEDFPKIKVVRNKDDTRAEYFGPYPESFPAKDVIRRLRKIFNYRTCNRTMYELNGRVICSDSKPCLYFHLGLCKAPCANKIGKYQYRKSINDIKRFLNGQKGEIVKNLEEMMKEASKLEQFEKASVYRDRLANIKYVLSKVKMDNDTDDVYVRELKSKERDNAVKDLFHRLNYSYEGKNIKDVKIECYDISNLQGTNPVGSMVVFVNGEPRTDLYRKFRIRTKNTPDDFSMHQEMMKRRLMQYINSSKDESFKDLPELMIIDGGKGQLTSVAEVIDELELSRMINLSALAKREEILYTLNSDEINKFNEIRIPKKAESLKLVQRIRDETHRFGITYHRKLRAKNMKV